MKRTRGDSQATLSLLRKRQLFEPPIYSSHQTLFVEGCRAINLALIHLSQDCGYPGYATGPYEGKTENNF